MSRLARSGLDWPGLVWTGQVRSRLASPVLVGVVLQIGPVCLVISSNDSITFNIYLLLNIRQALLARQK